MAIDKGMGVKLPSNTRTKVSVPGQQGQIEQIQGKARKAQDEIIAKLVTHCNANGIALATGAEAQITQAYTLGVVDTKQRDDASKIE